MNDELDLRADLCVANENQPAHVVGKSVRMVFATVFFFFLLFVDDMWNIALDIIKSRATRSHMVYSAFRPPEQWISVWPGITQK